MCLIIDANVAGNYSREGRNPDRDLIESWLKRGGRIASGGRLQAELARSERMLRLMRDYQQKTWMFLYSESEIDAAAAEIRLLPMESDDVHIVALARTSGARLLYTLDGTARGDKLMRDFRDPRLLPGRSRRLRGKIFRGAARTAHRRLLENAPPCRPPQR